MTTREPGQTTTGQHACPTTNRQDLRARRDPDPAADRRARPAPATTPRTAPTTGPCTHDHRRDIAMSDDHHIAGTTIRRAPVGKGRRERAIALEQTRARDRRAAGRAALRGLDWDDEATLDAIEEIDDDRYRRPRHEHHARPRQRAGTTRSAHHHTKEQ